jgi:hypothetical protein
MKMFFSVNKKHIIQVPKIENKNPLEKKQTYQAISYSLRYGLFARMQNTSNCSSCGK